MKKFLSFIVSLISLAAMLYFGIFIIVAVIISIPIFFLMMFILYNRKDSLSEKMIPGISGVTEYKINIILKDGREKITILKRESSHIKKPSVKNDLRTICSLSEQILKELKEDPRKVKHLRRFINYYLQSAVTIVQSYRKIENFDYATEEMKTAAEKAENSLRSFCEAFQNILVKMNENEILNLDVEIETTMNSFKSEHIKKYEKN